MKHAPLPTPARSEAEGRQAGSIPHVTAGELAAMVESRERTFADHLTEARARQSGAGFASPFLTVTDEALAQADAMIGWRLQRARNKRPAANGYRVGAYGLEKVS